MRVKNLVKVRTLYMSTILKQLGKIFRFGKNIFYEIAYTMMKANNNIEILKLLRRQLKG